VTGVHTSSTDGVGVITLDRQESLNAWDTGMQRAVAQSVRDFDSDDSITAVVVTGAGNRAFCAGQHLEETAKFSPDDVDGWLDNFKDLYGSLLSASKPVVAALNGVAAGSGYQLALVCDVRVAHHGVRIGQPEVSSGIPSVTGLYLTMLSVGLSRAQELMMSGRLMPAEEAHRLGIIHAVVPQDEVLSTSMEYAQRLGRQPRTAFRLTKRRLRDEIWPGLMEAFDAAGDIDRQAWASGEPQETAARFFAERRARREASVTAGSSRSTEA
jgi:enoyl-CoA hydratase/carnithine racemase